MALVDTAALPPLNKARRMAGPSRLDEAPSGSPVFAGEIGAEKGGLIFEVYDRIEQIGPAVWQRYFPAHWKGYSYYQTLEETFAGEFPQRYLVLREPAPDGAIRAIQPLFFVEQDMTVSLGAGLRAILQPIRHHLKMRLMMVGCIVGDAQVGVPSLADVRPVCVGLDDALAQYARHEGISIILFKDFPAEYRQGLAGLMENGGYARLPSLPAVGLDLGFSSFEEYVQTRLGKATRKSLRRKFKEVERATVDAPITLEVKHAVTGEEAADVHALYEHVARRGDVHFEVFSKEYFLRLGERMPEQARFFIWRQRGKVIAFSFCVVDADAIYDNDFGVDEELASSLNLYHVTFRDIVSWALTHGLRHYYSSPFNYGPKLHLRMHLVPLDLYARHTSPAINFFLRHFASWLAPTRQEPLLGQFANAPQLWR